MGTMVIAILLGIAWRVVVEIPEAATQGINLASESLVDRAAVTHNQAHGLLIGVGTSVCGASAIAAVAFLEQADSGYLGSTDLYHDPSTLTV